MNISIHKDIVLHLTKLKNLDREKKLLYNFRISENIWFLNDVWDFSFMNVSNREESRYKLHFTNIPESYVFHVKYTILTEIIHNNSGILNCHNILNKLGTISRQFIEAGMLGPTFISKRLVNDYFESRTSSNSASTMSSRGTCLKKLLETIQEVEEINLEDVIDIVMEIVSDAEKRRSKRSTNECIPFNLLDKIVSVAIKDINDESLKMDYRIIACLIVIMAETGMRGEEVTLLQTNMLNIRKVNNKEICYLKFLTFKSQGEEGKKTVTFLSDKALMAYKTCEKFIYDIVENSSERQKYRAILKLHTKGELKGKYSDKQLKDMISMIDNEKIKEYELQLKKYLFMSAKTMTQKKSEPLLRANLENFFIRHHQEFNINELSARDQGKVKKIKIDSVDKFVRNFSVEEREKTSFENIKSKEIIYVNPHMFRVTLCTKLFMQNVHIDFIVKHMNHLEPDMAAYYCKSEEFTDMLRESTEIVASMVNEKGYIEVDSSRVKDSIEVELLLDENSKKLIQKINTFVSEREDKKLNIVDDFYKIIEKLDKTDTPIVQNDYGACIRSLLYGICEKRQYFSTLYDNYYIGIQLPTYKYIHFSYEKFTQKIIGVEHNKKIAQNDDRYLLEYEREKKALLSFVNKSLKVEINLLENDIREKGIEYVINKYPEIENVVSRLEIIKEEVKQWIA